MYPARYQSFIIYRVLLMISISVYCNITLVILGVFGLINQVMHKKIRHVSHIFALQDAYNLYDNVIFDYLL